MPSCDKCHAETKRTPRAKRTGRQMVDSFMFPGLGDLLYWGQRTRFECSACGNVQPARDGYAMRLLKRLLIASAIVASFAGIGAVFSMEPSAGSLPSALERVVGFARDHALKVVFACVGAATAVLYLCIDAARTRK